MNKLKITEIQILPVKPNNGLIAFSSCVINNQFYIGNVAIYTSFSSESGFRLVYPTKTLPTGKQIHCFHPIDQETGAMIKNAIIDKYLGLMSKVEWTNERRACNLKL